MEDFMTNDGEPSLWSNDPIEKNARSIYTRTIFSEFKVQLRATTVLTNTPLKILLTRNVKGEENHKGLSHQLKRRQEYQELVSSVVKKDTTLGHAKRLLIKHYLLKKILARVYKQRMKKSLKSMMEAYMKKSILQFVHHV
ncbi:hypothetical protein ACMD2_26332, partial [Ananas comosus]